MTFKIKSGLQVGSTLVVDENGKLTTGLSTARTISLTGDVSGSVAFDGTSDVSITAVVADDSHTHSGTITSGAYTTHTTAYGTIQLGPMNPSWNHIYSTLDQPFYFNKQITVLGNLVWNSGNDGSGSGLDADLIDGQHLSDLDTRYVNVTGDTMTGVLTITNTNDVQLQLQSADSWTGISFNDGAVTAADYIWHNGTNSTFAIGGGGANISGKKLHVHGGMTIGSGIATSSNPTNGLLVETQVNAPIFYDSNDTAYYTDQTSQSRYAALKIGSGGNFNSGTTYPLQVSHAQRYLVGLNNSGYSSNYYPWLVHDSSDGASGLIFHYNAVGDVFFFNQNGVGRTDGSFRAPIFYDSNDTGYYLDPNSFSKITRAQVNWTASSGTAGPALRVSKGWDGGIGNYTYDTLVIESNDVATIRVGEADGTQGGICWGDGYNTYTSTHPMRFYTNGAAGNNIYSGMAGTFGMGITGGYAWSDGSFRAPIFYDSNNTSYYIDAADVSRVNRIRPSSIAHADGVRFSLPEGGAYTTSSSTVTGAIRIALPAALNNSSTMLSFTVHIYQYSTGRSHTFRIGGYNYGGGSWYNPFAINLSGGGDAYTVRFGTDGSRDMVWIGETNSSWSYPQVFVTDIQCGYSGFSDSWDRDWQISFQTSFNTVETSYQPPLLGNTIAVTGNITAYYSDGRLKDFHGTIPDAIDKVKKLNGYYFTENEEAKKLGYDNDKMQVGVCAQEVEMVLPEIIAPAPIDNKYITVQYEKLTPLLIEAIKEQQEIIESQETRIARLEMLVQQLIGD